MENKKEENLPPAPSCFEIKTSTLSLLVGDVKDAREKISEFTNEKEGLVAQSSITQRGDTSFGSFVVQVPAENFEAGYF